MALSKAWLEPGVVGGYFKVCYTDSGKRNAWRTASESCDRRVERSVQGGVMAFEKFCRFTHRRTFTDQPLTERDLLGAELQRSPEPDAACSCGATPAAGALVDEHTLELRDASEYG